MSDVAATSHDPVLAAAQPPKTLEQLTAEHDAATQALAGLEKPKQDLAHAEQDYNGAVARGEKPEVLEPLKAALVAAAQAHARAGVTPRQIDVAAQAVIDARDALIAAKGE